MTHSSAQPVWRPLVLGVLALCDGLITLGALGAAAFLADPEPLGWHQILLSIVVAFAVPICLAMTGAYRFESLGVITAQVRQVGTVVTAVFMVLLLIAFLLKTTADWSRGFAIAGWAGSVMALALVRGVVATMMARWREEGRAQISIALVGATDIAQQLVDYLKANATYYEIVGIFDDRQTRSLGGGTQISGNVEDLKALRRSRHIDQVIVTISPQSEQRVVSLIERLRDISVDIRLAFGGMTLQFLLRDLSHLGGYPVFHVTERPLSDFDVALKRAMDLVIACTAIALLSPILGAAALAVRLSSPGPILFRQPRHGLNNSVFQIYKFRSMRANAEGSDGSAQAVVGDARLTRVGAFLRRWSIDELPQLFNVVNGDMSLVGPRPHPVTLRAVDQPFESVVRNYASRHRMRPGITGWAQVNGWRGATDTLERAQARIEHDIHYIEHWSILFDLEILALTVPAVIAGKNAV